MRIWWTSAVPMSMQQTQSLAHRGNKSKTDSILIWINFKNQVDKPQLKAETKQLSAQVASRCEEQAFKARHGKITWKVHFARSWVKEEGSWRLCNRTCSSYNDREAAVLSSSQLWTSLRVKFIIPHKSQSPEWPGQAQRQENCSTSPSRIWMRNSLDMKEIPSTMELWASTWLMTHSAKTSILDPMSQQNLKNPTYQIK